MTEKPKVLRLRMENKIAAIAQTDLPPNTATTATTDSLKFPCSSPRFTSDTGGL